MPIRILPKDKGRRHRNTSRENRLEELGRVDAEKAYTSKGKRNLREEKSRIRKELATGGRALAGLTKGMGPILRKRSPDAKGGFRPITRRPAEKKKREKGLVIVKVGGSAEGFKDAKKIKGKPHSSPEGKFFSKLRTQPLKIKFNKGGRAKHNIGGRANLLEEMGRIDARRHPDAADRSEKRRVIGELNRGYKSGGAVLKGKKVGCQIK
jgi:hypothetical protein